MRLNSQTIQHILFVAVLPYCAQAYASSDSTASQDIEGKNSVMQSPERAVGSNQNNALKVPSALETSNLEKKSDEQLTALTARWADLDPSQRRELLAEVRGRMARSNTSIRIPIRVSVQRKYGRVVRKPDGSVVVQTRVIKITPRQMSAPSRHVTFGIGFEQRTKSQSPSEQPQVESSDSVPPTMTVGQQQSPPDTP